MINTTYTIRPLSYSNLTHREFESLMVDSYQVLTIFTSSYRDEDMYSKHLEGFLPLPKSVTPSRIASNLDCFDIELSPADLEILKNISGLEGGAPNPDGMDF